MNESLWRYIQNPFQNATKHNTKLMNLLATDHYDKLKRFAQTDARIMSIFSDFEPIYEAFAKQYVKLLGEQRVYQGYTAQVEEQFALLSSLKIRQWDIIIQYNYDETSYFYTMLLPRGRSPFQGGGYESRIREVKSLSYTLRSQSMLPTLQQEVEAFGLNLEGLRTKQQGAEGQVSQLSLGLENARVALAIAMHRVLGSLITLYADDISQIEYFYDFEYLRTAAPDKKDENTDSTDTGDTNPPPTDTTP